MAEYIEKQHLMEFLDGCIEEEKGNRSQVIVKAIKMVVERMPSTDATKELTDTNVGKWIPVTEQLPKRVRKSYLCLTDTGYHCEVRWTDNVYGLLTSSMDNEWGWSIADVPQFCKITHWMPLPEPPKEEEK